MGETDFCKANLHRLFRLFDQDNSGTITHTELRSGLLAMGLRQADDPVAVSKLLLAVRGQTDVAMAHWLVSG